jgi:NADPH:quinone reductase-like Zn-dependent oxidoreductase
MRAAVVEAVGSPPAVGDVDEPVPDARSALVEVEAAPLNPVEIRVAAGRHPRQAQPPYVPGLEGVGRVVESARIPPGRRVRFESAALPGFGANGTLAERAAVPEESLVVLPDEAPADLAAALGVVGITALLAIERAAPAGGERVLVLGATGAVGQAAVQLAKLLGAGRVVGAGRNSGRFQDILDLGADAMVDLGDSDLPAAFEEAAGGPLDIVIDPLWGEPAMAALRVLATEGRLVNVGQSAGTDVRIPLELVRNRQGAIHAISSGWTGLERKASVYDRLLDYALSGHLTVDREVLPLEDVGSAWERQGASPGRKLVIRIGQRG